MINEVGNVAHYTSLENLANILYDKRIRLGSVTHLADPRECSLGWIDTIGIGSNLTGWQNAEELKRRVGEQLRIFCTAGMNDELPIGSCPIESSIYGRPRMWTQYGGNSKGFCIVLNQNRLNQALELLVDNPDHLLSGKVDYLDWIHIIHGGANIEYGDGISTSGVDIFKTINSNNMLSSIYLKKNIDWEGEHEFRWLLFSKCTETMYFSIENAVEAVVLGCEFPLNQLSQAKTYCESLGCSCYKLKYNHPKYHLITIVK